MVFFDLVLCQIEKGIRVGFLPRVSNGTASGRSWLVGRFFRSHFGSRYPLDLASAQSLSSFFKDGYQEEPLGSM